VVALVGRVLLVVRAAGLGQCAVCAC
jgi:hypothetical protein